MDASTNTVQLNALLPRCREGEEDAFVEAYQLVGSRLYGAALRILKRPQEAEEAVQEAFVRLLENAANIRTGNLAAWLHRVTVNHCLDRVKAKAHSEEQLPEDFQGLRAGAQSAEKMDLERAVERLPQRARLVFLLHDVEGFKHREVAETLGIREGTSKAQLFRAREMLRAWLAAAEVAS